MRPYLWLTLAICLGFLATQWLGLLGMVLVAAAALVGLVGWCVALEVMDARPFPFPPRLRAAHDHDKETPPKGWREPRPTNPATGRLVCSVCGFDVGDTETVMIRNGEVLHVACARGAGK